MVFESLCGLPCNPYVTFLKKAHSVISKKLRQILGYLATSKEDFKMAKKHFLVGEQRCGMASQLVSLKSRHSLSKLLFYTNNLEHFFFCKE